MLRVRLALLDDIVDTFVVVEADRTHAGDRKPWQMPDDVLDNQKVVYRQVSLTATHAWGRENEQRRAMKDAVEWLDPPPDSLVCMSDCDELWDGRFRPSDGIRVAAQDFRLFSVFWRYPIAWQGTIGGPWSEMAEADWQGLRDSRWRLPAIRSGWHLSWMGDDEARRVKQRSFAHLELADEDFTGLAADGAWVNGQRLVETDEGLPDALLDAVPGSWKRRRVS